MANQIYNYALIKSLFDEGQSYIDSFLFFVLNVLELDHTLDLESVQERLKQKYMIEMPLHVLYAVLKRIKRKGYAIRQDKDFKLTDNGQNFLNTFETDKAVDRRINALFVDIGEFFGSNNVSLSRDQTSDLLNELLNSNIGPLFEFVNPSAKRELTIQNTEEYQNLLIDYIKLAENQKPSHYNTIRDMVLGSMISAVLYTTEFSEIDELTRSKFRHCEAYLDANYVLSILGMDDQETNEAAKELLDLLKKFAFKLHVFDFTINEISRLLGHYIREGHRYPTTVNINSICSRLKRNGWSKSDVVILISKLPENLEEVGVKTRWLTGVNLQNYEPKDNILRSRIRQYKPDQSLQSQNHDLAAVEQIQQYRAKTFRRLEHCEAIFLTSDTRLNRFNYIEMGHRTNRTTSEVILDRLLTVILWLKNPTAKIPLKSVIAAHSKERFINQTVWDRFYAVLKDLSKAGKVEDEDVSTLFYNNYIEDALSDLSDIETERITEEFVLDHIEKAAKIKEEEVEELVRKHKETIKEKESEFLRQLHEDRSKTEYEKDREWIGKITESKESIYNNVNRSVNSNILKIKIAIAVLFGIPLIICLAKGDWAALLNVWKIVSIGFVILGVAQFFIPRLWEILQEKWTERSYKKRVKEAKLDEYQLQ